MMTFCEAVAREEGFGKPGTRPTRNNNPGDIEFGKFALAHGATHAELVNGRFAVFPDAATGFAAMKALFQTQGYQGKTIAEALNRWAPTLENETNAYIENVCEWTGLRSDTVIDGIL